VSADFLPTENAPVTRAANPLATAIELPTEVVALPETDFGRVVRLGLWLLAVGFGGFLVWAFLAPLDEGVPAAGILSVESSRKRIDHPNGGVVEEILVRDGQPVNAGDVLVVLNETQSKSALDATLSQYHTSLSTLARLHAERTGAPTIAFAPELVAAEREPAVAAVMRAQQDLFGSRRRALDGELRILRESALGLETQLASLSQLRAGREKQIALFREQLDSYETLKERGFLSRNHVLEVERQLAEVQSKQSEDLANISSINARLAEFRMRGAQREVEYRREVETQLAETQRDVATLGERLTAQRDTFDRLAIRAPVSGTVVDLAIHTVGGVVKPGDRLLDIVPDSDELIVEAKVAPQYADRLRVGLPADVHLDAYADRAQQPLVRGEVAVVSADALVDPHAGQPYYAVRVSVPRSELGKLGDLRLAPGMLATVMLRVGERSLAAYLARPLLRRFKTAMTE
jgi:protease secretion system membrane fusion protein